MRRIPGRAQVVAARPDLLGSRADGRDPQGHARAGAAVVTCREDGTHLSGHCLRKPMRRAMRATGLPGITFHDLRHSFASQLVMAGVAITAVQESLGHADLPTTMRYAHPSPAARQAYVEVLDASSPSQIRPTGAREGGSGHSPQRENRDATKSNRGSSETNVRCGRGGARTRGGQSTIVVPTRRFARAEAGFGAHLPFSFGRIGGDAGRCLAIAWPQLGPTQAGFLATPKREGETSGPFPHGRDRARAADVRV